MANWKYVQIIVIFVYDNTSPPTKEVCYSNSAEKKNPVIFMI